MIDLPVQSLTNGIHIGTVGSIPRYSETRERVIQPKPRILVVEDIGTHRKLFRDLLRAYGFDVLELEDGIGLWEKIGDVRIDAALIDVFLPQISGITIVGMLRARWDAVTLPIIGVSAMPYADTEQSVLAAGANAYFTKPVGLRDLAIRFADLLGYRLP